MQQINVGVVGLGMMGGTHLDVYAGLEGVTVVAVADLDEARRTGKAAAAGNIEGQAQGGFDFGSVRQYADAAELIADAEVHLVDICLPTPLHLRFAKQALEAGKHVLVEKPLARTADEARQLAAAAAQSKGLAMCAMCMRFWPGWTWLKEAVDAKRYGKVLAATFRRVADHPDGAFYADGDACGGAIFDLHIHDADFVQYVFGMPKAVSSVGYAKDTNQTDHVVTQYRYDDIPMVVAEGGWSMAKGFGFHMQYTVNFERATAVFDISQGEPLTLYEPGKDPAKVPLDTAMGYQYEIEYFIDCIRNGKAPQTVTLGSAAESVRLVEAEKRSIETGQPVAVAPA